MAVAADDGEAGLGQAHFRPDDVDDAAVFSVIAEQAHAVAGGVALQGLDLGLGLGGDVGAIALRVGAQGRNRVIERGKGAVGTTYLQTAGFELRKGLGRGDLVDEVQVDIEDGRLIGAFRFDDVGIPHFFE